MRKSAIKTTITASAIQRTVTSRNIIQDKGNINKFWEGNRLFCC